MCSISVFISHKKKMSPDMIKHMKEKMYHRGPDDCGHVDFKNINVQVVLIHNRLSILDLTSAGHQPMAFEDLTIVYNGEVYNFKEIRAELKAKGHTFNSNCDTEVILHSFKEWGMECVNKFIGMFAFAIYDHSNNKIYICRDRAGVKPLFYYHHDGMFCFGSELKAMVEYPGFDKSISDDALAAYFQLTYIPADMCIYKHAKKLLPGYWCIYDIFAQSVRVQKYWDIQDYYKKPKLEITYEEAKSQLKEILKSAFGYRMISDVPVGVFLSGGIDSALVSAILTKELDYNIDTFTIGFKQGNNEAPEAELIAKHLGTNHTTKYCSEQDALDLIPQLSYYYDEPINNPGAVSFMLVSKLAKEKVVCALSGDGADEIFAGYNYYETYVKSILKYQKLNKIPFALRKIAGIPFSILNKLNIRSSSSLFRAEMLGEDNIDYKNFIINEHNANRNNIGRILNGVNGIDLRKYLGHIKEATDSPDFGLLYDFKLLMPDNYIVKIERGSMWCSLECREPFLDHRIAEFGAQLPWEYKFFNGNKKRILKDIAYDYIPKHLLEKPKTGFVVPIEYWLRNNLKEYVHETLRPSNLIESRLNRKIVERLLKEYESGRGNIGLLWSILQYQDWYNKWILNK